MPAARPPASAARSLAIPHRERCGGDQVGGQLSSSSGDVLHGWALEGRGLSLEALWDVAETCEAGRLVECLAEYQCESIELFATFQPGQPMPPRVRLFVDFMAATHLS